LNTLIQKKYISEEMGNIRYQLLTGSMGTIKLAEQQKIKKCVFCIYQLYKNENKIVDIHEQEINDFLKILGINKGIENNLLIGPINKNSKVELYLSYLKRKI
jgi:hypothetical protein